MYKDARLVNSIPTHLARAGDSGLRSTTTSNIASGATDELDLFIRGSLEVEAAERAAMVIERDAPLRVMSAEPSLHEQIAAERTRKKTSIVFQLLELDDQRPRDIQWGK
jgi:hypothetical protein